METLPDRHVSWWHRGYALVGNDEAAAGAGDSFGEGTHGHVDSVAHREHFERGRGRCGWLIGRCVAQRIDANVNLMF